MFRRALQLLAVICAAALFAGCANPQQQESDWRWQQMNPNYHPPYPLEDAYRR